MALESNQPIQIVYKSRTVRTRAIRVMRTELYLDALRDAEMELTPMPGQRVALRWSDDETLFQQFAKVTDVLDPIPIIVVKLEGRPQVLEMRQSARIKVALPLEYGLVRPNAQLLMTTTLDISATGLRFPSAMMVWTGLELRMRLRIEQHTIGIIGKVVRVSPKARIVRGRESWETAIRFTMMMGSDRRLLEAYLRQQRARLSVGR